MSSSNHSNLGFYALIIAFAAVVGSGVILERKLFTSMFGVEEIEKNIFVGREVSMQDRGRFLRNYGEARQKVAAFFGSVSAEPRIVVCGDWACYERIGGERPGNGQISHGAAYGKRFFQISPASLRDVKTVAHEFAHVEIAKRLGRGSKFNRLPAWFNEGVATIIADDAKHSEQAYAKIRDSGPAPNVRAFKTSGQWASAGGNIRDNYTTAAHEVRVWMKRAGGPGAVVELLNRLKNGADFETEYNNLAGFTRSPST